mgnify:CR=1 FL=1
MVFSVPLEKRLKEARVRLAARQMTIKERNLPVLILLEGWGAAGKGFINMKEKFHHKIPVIRKLPFKILNAYHTFFILVFCDISV